MVPFLDEGKYPAAPSGGGWVIRSYIIRYKRTKEEQFGLALPVLYVSDFIKCSSLNEYSKVNNIAIGCAKKLF